MVGQLVWPVASVLIAPMALWYLNRWMSSFAELGRQSKELAEKKLAVELQERQNAAAIEDSTKDEHAQAEKARLLRQAAKDEAAAEVAKQTIGAQVEAEKAVIAAAAEGRALRAKQEALTAQPDGAEKLKLLLDAYKNRSEGLSNASFGHWVGKFDPSSL